MISCIKYFLSVASVLIWLHPAFAQKKLEKEKKQILGEGLALYTLILANWTSNDLYYENEFNTGYVKGYLSYRQKDTVKTIFWREMDTASAEYKAKNFKQVGDTGAVAQLQPKKTEDLRLIVKTICYPKMSVKKTNAEIVEEEEREPNQEEKVLMDYRAMVYKEINTDTSFFKQYEGIALKAVPFDAGKEVKVYIYSSVKKEGVIPFGGDYLLVYDKKTQMLLEKTSLHNDCVFVSVQYRGKSYDVSKATVHTHKAEASELITPTDIATLMLYKNQLEWDEHHVVGEKHTSVFTLVDKKLDIMPAEYFEYLKKKKLDGEKEEKKGKMH